MGMRKTPEINETFRVLLVFPPVWTPVTPYLALPLLVGYLRKEGFSVTQYDASLDFFDQYLLKEETLFDLWDMIKSRNGKGEYTPVPQEEKSLLDDLETNHQLWADKVSGVRGLLAVLRGETAFYEPRSCIKAQSGIYDL